MRIAIGCDHGAFALKNKVIEHLEKQGHEVRDFGTYSTESCDYPDFAAAAARAVASGECQRGIVLCTTGIGVSITANKIDGIRCALLSDPWSAKMTRLHNDTNMMALGAGVVGENLALEIVDVWLGTEFSGEREVLSGTEQKSTTNRRFIHRGSTAPAPRSSCRSPSLLLHPYRLLNQFVQARRSNAANHILQLHPFQIQNCQRDGFQAIFASYVRIGVRIYQHGKRLAVLRFGIRFYRLDVIHGRAAPRSVKNKKHLAAGKFRKLPHVLSLVIHPYGGLFLGFCGREDFFGRVKRPFQRARSGLFFRITGATFTGIVAPGQSGRQQTADQYEQALFHPQASMPGEGEFASLKPIPLFALPLPPLSVMVKVA